MALRHAIADAVAESEGGAPPCCIDGWIPGDTGVERCDDCQRFPDDDAAREHVREAIRTLLANYGEPKLGYEDEERPDSWIERALGEWGTVPGDDDDEGGE